jgi:hypothetical protein
VASVPLVPEALAAAEEEEEDEDDDVAGGGASVGGNSRAHFLRQHMQRNVAMLPWHSIIFLMPGARAGATRRVKR